MVLRREAIKWENGEPVPIGGPPLTKSQIAAMNLAAVAMPYQPTVKVNAEGVEEIPEEEKRFQREDGTWVSKLEAGIHRRADQISRGDTDVLREVEDRILGKPMQQVQSFTVTATFEALMLSVQQNESGYQPPALPDYMAEIPIVEGEIIELPIAPPLTLTDDDDDCPV